MEDNYSKLYKAMVNSGYDIADLGGSEDDFRREMQDSTTRKNFYDWVSNNEMNGFRIGSYDAYEERLAPKIESAPQPAPQVEAAQGDNQAGVQSSIIPGMRYGELATSFMEDINLRKRVSNAEVDDSAVEAALQKTNARRSAQMQQGATMRGAFDRALATTKRNELSKSLEEQLGAAEGNIVQMLGERDAQIESANRERENNTPWYARLGAAKGGGIPSQAMTSNGRFTDPEWRMLNAANRIIGESKELIDAAKNDRGMWTGIGRTLADVDTWTSLMEGLDAKAIEDVADVDLEKATPAQLALLDALAMRVAVEEQYGGDISSWYKAGETIGNMAPLAAETMLNPASGLGRKAAQAMLKKVATKGAKGLAKRIGQQAAIKGAGYLGSMAGGAAMSSTTSLPGIAVRAKMNSIGDAQYDVDQYGNVGFAGFKPGESYGKEFLKEFGRTTFERATEQMGAEWLSKLIGKPLGWIGKGVMKIPGAKSVTGKVGDLLDNKVGDALKKLAKDVNYQGPIEEFGEEFVSALHTASIDGMDSLKKWFEGDNLETTAIAVTTPALLGLGASATYGAVDYKRGAKAKSKQMQAYKEGFEAFADMPEDWKTIVINLNSPSGIIDEMKRIYNDPIYTNKQKIAALTYGARTMEWMGTEGVKGVNTDENVRMLNEMLGARYREGYEQEPTGENAVKEANEYTNARNEVVRVLSLAEDADVDAMLEGRTPEEIAMGDGEIEDAVGRYIQARARRDGFRERYQEERDRQFAESDRSIDERTNNGTVYGVATENGEAFITSGTVVLNEEGEIDYANSEKLVVMFPDGTKKPVQSGSLPGKVTVQNAEDLKAAGRASIEERWRAEFESAENAYVEQQKRAEGIVFDITDGKGTHRVEVVKEGDNMSNILVDGEQKQISTEELNALRGEAGVAQTENGDVEGENEVQPEVAPVVEDQIGDNTEKVVEPVGEAVAPVAAAPKTALEQIPRNEKNVPLYEQVDSELAWDGVVEEAGGNEDFAMVAVNSMIADKQDALKKAEKAKAKAGVTITEKIAAENKRVANIEKAKADLAKWEEIAGVKAKRAAAQAENVAQSVAEVEPPQATNEMQEVDLTEDVKTEDANQSENNLEMVAEGGNAPGNGGVVDNNSANTLQNSNNELNLQKENESDNESNQNEIPVGRQVPQSVPQGEHGTQASQVSGMEETASRLRERIEADGGTPQGGLSRNVRDVENRVTREYAQENGLWIPFEDVFKLGRPSKSGNEHDTYLNAEQGVIYKVNNRMNTPSILDLLDRMEQHNEFFPDSKYSLVGFTAVSENGDVWPVFAQEYVPNARMATNEEIDSYMGALGFTRVGDGRYSNGEVVIKDLKSRNVLADADGDIYVVDAEFEQENAQKSGETAENGGENAVPEWLDKVPNDGRNFFVYVMFAGENKYQAIDLGKGETVDRLVRATMLQKEQLQALVENLPSVILEDAEFQIRDAKGNIYYNSGKVAAENEVAKQEDKEVAAFDKQAEIAEEREQRAGVAPRPGHLAVAIGEGNEKAVEEWKTQFDSYLQKLNADDLPTIDVTIKGMQGRKKDIRKMKKDGYKDDSIYKAYDYIETVLKKRAAELKKVSATEQPKQENKPVESEPIKDETPVTSETTEQPEPGEVANAGPVNVDTLQLNMSEEDFNALLSSGDKAVISEYLAEMDGLLRIGVGSPLDGRDAIVKEYRGLVEQYGGEGDIPADVVAGINERIAPYNALQRAVFDRKYALQDKLREIEASEAQAKEQAEKEAKAEHKQTAFGGFLAGKSDVGASTAEKALSKKYNFDGKVMMVAEFVEDAVGNGNVKLSAIEEPKYKGASRAAWNRMDARQQEADAKRVKESGTKTVYTVNDHDLGKTAYDYAKFLLDKKAEQEKAAAKQKVKDAIEPFAKEKAAEQATIKIEDVGEKIGGARKDIIRQYADKIKLDGKTFSTMFPKPDIDKLVEAGLPKDKVAAVKAMYDNAKKEFEIAKKRRGKDKALQASLFYAMYAKNVLTGEEGNFDLAYNGFVFTEWGKEFMKANIALYKAVFNKLGTDYGKVDLRLYFITPLAAGMGKNFNLKKLNEENSRMQQRMAEMDGRKVPEYKDGDVINFVGEHYSRPSDQFETLEEAVNTMVERISKEVKVDEAAQYKVESYWKRDAQGRADYTKAYLGIKVRGFGTVDVMEFKNMNEANTWLQNHKEDFQQMAAAKEEQVKAENKKPLPKYVLGHSYNEAQSQYSVFADFGKEGVKILKTFNIPQAEGVAAQAKARSEVYKNDVLPYMNSEEAVQSADGIAQEIRDAKNAKPKSITIEKKSRERVGVDWRNGKDATPEMFVDVEGKEPSVFGFRAIEFGNYVSQKERQQFLNDIYDALMDMSEILGVSPRALSLGGKLALAVGARGTSGASGHYEPYKNVINITKTRGAGVLAHEWLHALDRYFSNFDENMVYPNGTRYATQQEYSDDTRQEVKDAFEKVMLAVKASDYRDRSMRLGEYWASEKELAARALQDYVIRKLEERGQKNDFLSNHVAPEEWDGDAKGYPFPLGEDVKRIADAFDNLFATLEEKTTEDGNVVLYSIAEDAMLKDKGTEAFKRATKVTMDAVERLKANGLDIEVVSQEEADAMMELAEMKKRTALETVSVQDEHLQTVVSSAGKRKSPETALPEDESSFKGTAISGDDGTKILKDIDSAIAKYENSNDRAETFIGNVAKALGIDAKDKSSKYATFEAKNGVIFTIRISNHNATVSNFDNAGEENGISIVISRKPNEGITNDGNAHLVEFFYPEKKISKADGKPLVEILKSIKQALYSGEYKDNTGLAVREEVNIPEMMTVFHGSGAKFDKFDHSFMNTGEGAQFFGWGTYVTEVEGIGRTYATTMRDKLISEKHKENAIINKLAKQILESSNGNKEETLDYLRGLLNESWSDKKRVKAQIKIIETGKFLPETKLKANLYIVEIPDDNGSNYLHWDERINGEIQERIANGLQSIGFEIEPDLNHLVYSRDEKIVVLNINAKGKDLYAELSEALGGDKAASLFLNNLGFVGISYPANATTGGRADGARNYVIFNENDAQITDRVEFFEKNGKVYGWAVGGKIRLTPDGINPNTPVHEYAHLWGADVEKNNPKLWNEVVEAMKLSPVWDEVANDANYSNIHGNASRMASEVLARLSGRENYRRTMEEAEKEIAAERDIVGKVQKKGILNRIKNALKNFWNWVQRNVFKRGESNEALQTKSVNNSSEEMPWEEFANSVIGDFYKGKNPDANESQLEKMAAGENSAETQEGETLFRKADNLSPEEKERQKKLKENAKAIRRLHNVKANFSLTALRNLGFALETQEQREMHDRLFAERDAMSGRENAVSVEVNPQAMTLQERITESLLKMAEQNKDNVELRLSAIRAYGRDLANVIKLMRAQRGYDRNTVNMFVSLAKMYLRNNAMSGMSSYDISRLLGLISRANGGYGPQVMRAAEQIAEIITKSHTRELEDIVRKQIKTGAEKVNASGVVVQSGVDVVGKRVLNTFRDAINMTSEEEFEKAFREAFERAAKFPNDVEVKAACDAMVIAKEYRDNIVEAKRQESELLKSINQYSNIRSQYDRGEITRKEYNEFVDAVRKSLIELRSRMVDDYQRIIHALGGDISEGMKRAKEFRERELARVEKIHNMAEADMSGVSKSAERKKRGFWRKATDYVAFKNPLAKVIAEGLGTYNEFMKFFGRNAIGGKGRLHDYFIGRYTEVQNQEWVEKQKDIKKINERCEMVFGKGFKDVMRDSEKNSGVVLEYWNGGERVSRDLSIGQLMYIYMTAKQTDGEMMLRGMGITEETVNKAVAVLPARYKVFADWVQSDFLPEMRPRLNEVHKRMFGASMSEVKNYFPLVVNTDARQAEVDLNSVMPITPSTITGSIIKRKVNATPLNLESNAFDVLLKHVSDMEHWAAFAEFTRDNNTLIGDKDFMNRVKNSRDLRFGDGEAIWNNFVETARITTGNYRAKKDEWANVMKGVSSAKITFGYYTALKQILSSPAMWLEAGAASIIKATVNPLGSWRWAIENLPGFEERWKGRTAGNERLADSDSDWSIWDNRVVKAAREAGMAPNAFVDAVVVSTGARAVYDSRKRFYKALGLSQEEQHKRALKDAAVAYNETQQSAQGAYLSILQKEGGFKAVVMTLYRNSQMAYSRKVTGSMAELYKKAVRWKAIIDDEEKRYLEMGLSKENAKKEANKALLKSAGKDVATLVMFGYVLNMVWYLGEQLPYLLFGDDEEEKEKIMDTALKIGATGMFEGFALGNVAKDLYVKGVTGNRYSSDMLTTPFASDAEKIINRFANDGTLAGMSQLLILGAETATGISPQRLIDDVAAVIDICNGDLDKATKVTLLTTRLAKVPQSQIDKLYLEEALGGDVVALAERYAEYKRLRDYPLNIGDDKILKKYAERFKKAHNEDLKEIVRDENAYEGYFSNASPEEKIKLAGYRGEYLEELTGKKAEEVLTGRELVYYTLYGRKEQNLVYSAMTTPDDVDDEICIEMMMSELQPMMDEYNKLRGDERKAYREENLEQIQFYKKLNAHKNNVNNLKGAMKKKPEEAQEKMEKIRKIRTKAIDLINNYNE